jgi:Zn-dependent M28 family amino/carboxypeptidase
VLPARAAGTGSSEGQLSAWDAQLRVDYDDVVHGTNLQACGRFVYVPASIPEEILNMRTYLSVFAIAACLTACASDVQQEEPTPASLRPNAEAAIASITAEDILAHVGRLASDEFEGRGPGTRGEELTVAYLTEQLQKLGLQPGNPDGTWVQDVPLVGYTARPEVTLTAGGKTIPLRFATDYVARSRDFDSERIDIAGSDIVFVGYGVVAPEYGWDDYKDVDVRGKTILMLINDPAVPDATNPTKLDPNSFKGSAMTYYGRWTYKYEIATEKGAAAAIVIHETGPAGYPYEVIGGGWSGEHFDIKTTGNGGEVSPVESWLREEKARELFQAAGQDFDALKRAAVGKDFRPVPLAAKATFRLRNTLREVQSKNVIAKLEGTTRQDEYVIYTAHWDHLGRDTTIQGDQIFNGAVDNASGTAGVLEIAEAFTKLTERPERSVLFLLVTAEEQGLLGAKYYATHPLYPLNKTLANINIDGLTTWGRARDVEVVGYGNSTLDDVLADATRLQNRTVTPDAEPEKGFFYRSDQFEFAKEGVPALYTHRSSNLVDYPPEHGRKLRDDFTAQDYHKPSDEVRPDWDMRGAVEDAQLMFMVGYTVAQRGTWPEWKAGTEFKATREASLVQ